ncbi:hypothetical protein C5F63_14065 [Photobacterium damselae subsp. damselae]|nr:hypothetical protein C5F63_14065 [Photobacterium damselae subsp. damselae]
MNPVREFCQVLTVIFPLTLIVPQVMQPLLDMLFIQPNHMMGVLIIDAVIVACAVFVFLPLLNKIVERLMD